MCPAFFIRTRTIFNIELTRDLCRPTVTACVYYNKLSKMYFTIFYKITYDERACVENFDDDDDERPFKNSHSPASTLYDRNKRRGPYNNNNTYYIYIFS